MANMDVHFSQNTDKWETPQWLFDKLNRIFNFDLDVCANEENHKCERYFTEEDNGLSKNWGGASVGAILRMADRLLIGLRKHQKRLRMTIPSLCFCFQLGRTQDGSTTTF